MTDTEQALRSRLDALREISAWNARLVVRKRRAKWVEVTAASGGEAEQTPAEEPHR
jgi:hypothetical protein